MEQKDNPLNEESCLTRVRAQVMTREDGGWVPVEGGGYSIVGIYKLLDGGNTLGSKIGYKIVGTTCSSQKRVLECNLRPHVEYTSATPTFHHWRTLDEKKCGLTFSSPADGRAFERGFRRALEELREGSSSDSSLNPNDEEESEGFPNDPLLMDTPRGDPYVNTPTCFVPQSRERTNLRELLVQPPSFLTQQPFHKIHYLTHDKCIEGRRYLKKSPDNIWKRTHPEWHSPKRDLTSSNEHSNDSYVELVKFDPGRHDYIYPAIQNSSGKGEDDLKKHYKTQVIKTQPPPPPPSKAMYNHGRSRCLHCGEKFDAEKNKRGECPDAPDSTLNCIGKVTCISCAQGLLYHCFVDVDGDYPELEDPCACTANDSHFCKRWTSLALLSVLVPCLWCYIPLRACHWCGKQCGCCGGRHKPTP